MSTEGEAELPPAPAGDVGGGSHSRHVDLDGSKFDLNALFNFTHLQDFLRTLAAQQRQQMQLIQGLRGDLEKANREGEVVAQKLKAEIDTKATEKALTALALETSRDKAAMQRKHENLESTMTKRFEKNEAKTEQLQSKIYDCKVELETKAAQRTVDALTTRVDACATAVELADVKTQITTRLDESDKENNERHERNEATQQMNTKRIVAIEQMAKGLCTKKELEEVEGALKEKDQALLEEIENVESRGVAALAETKRQTDIHFARNEEVLDQHWQHIRNAEELLRTKADREVVQQDFEKAAANLAALDKRVTDEHNTFVDSTMAWMNTTDERVGVLEKRQKSSEDLLATKASKTETEELRQAVALCSLRTEMRELLEALRQETNSRVRMLKERLDRTDRELLRQLEESQNNDRSDKFDALAAIVETKADKAMTERWLEASQQLHGELQAVHVRTQTLGQGMKVVLGWVEGMADKVQGLQGAQHRLAQQAVAQKEEQQFALNATARETIGKVKTMLASQASAMPPSSPRTNAFEGSKPRSRPTTGARLAVRSEPCTNGVGGSWGGGWSRLSVAPPCRAHPSPLPTLPQPVSRERPSISAHPQARTPPPSSCRWRCGSCPQGRVPFAGLRSGESGGGVCGRGRVARPRWATDATRECGLRGPRGRGAGRRGPRDRRHEQAGPRAARGWQRAFRHEQTRHGPRHALPHGD